MSSKPLGTPTPGEVASPVSTAAGASVPPVQLPSERTRCPACRKPLYYYDAQGQHHKCGKCHTVTSIPWADLLAQYRTFHPSASWVASAASASAASEGVSG